MPVINLMSLTSEFTLPYLLCKNKSGTLNIFFPCQLAVSFVNSFAGERAFPPGYSTHLEASCTWILGLSSTALTVVWVASRLLQCPAVRAHTASPASGSYSSCKLVYRPIFAMYSIQQSSAVSSFPQNPHRKFHGRMFPWDIFLWMAFFYTPENWFPASSRGKSSSKFHQHLITMMSLPFSEKWPCLLQKGVAFSPVRMEGGLFHRCSGSGQHISAIPIFRVLLTFYQLIYH